MEHNNNMHLQAPALHHWGYAAATAVSGVPSTPTHHPHHSHHNWAPPPQSHGHKRSMSESDCEELYSEESSKEQISPSEPGSCQLMSRKKRRGVIEKKRRDRINSSLSELKRLVPSAYEKQGSAKLEKAEILQLTVEHLKNLHSKGMDSLSYDPQRFAMDYHIIGFRECAAEVARYLVTIEGMDIQDPLRLRLMSHLQYFVQQRELSVKSCAASPVGGWTTPGASGAFQPNCAVAPYQAYATTSASAHSTSAYVTNLPAPIQAYPTLTSSPSSSAHLLHHQQQQQQQQHQQHSQHQQHVSRSSSTTSGSVSNETMPPLLGSHNVASQQQQQPPHTLQTSTQAHDNHHRQQQYVTAEQQQQQHTQHHPDHQQSSNGATYIELTNAHSRHSSHTSHRPTTTPNADANAAAAAAAAATAIAYGTPPQYPGSVPSQEYNPNTGGLNYVAPNGSKPYRPWGAEMAY